MTPFLIIAIPLLMMLFALGMERVENRLRDVAVDEDEIEEFLEQARPDEVGALFRSGIGRALELFRWRRRSWLRAPGAQRASGKSYTRPQ